MEEYIFVVLCIFLSGFFVFFTAQFVNVVFHGFAPFLKTKEKTREEIIQKINYRADNNVYELGCGKANFLRSIAKDHPSAKLFGVENSLVPWLIIQIQKYLFRIENLKIIKQNLFLVDLSKADIIYCYLNIASMKKLGEKFKKECRPGTQIISNKFQIPGWVKEKTINSNNNKVYFYKLK